MFTHKWAAITIILIVIIGVASYIITSQMSEDSNTTPEVSSANDPRAGINTSSKPEDLKDPITKLKDNPPADSASSHDKAEYYRKLAQLQGDSTDYGTAIQTFAKEEQVAKDAMTYKDYYMWAYFYQMSGDKQKTIEKLKVVLTMLPDTDEANTGYSKSELTSQINARIKELSE